jgi:putative flippase GtrA
LTRIKKHITREELRSFIGFFLTGLFGATVNFLSQIPLKGFFLKMGLNDHPAFAWSVFWAYMISTAASFLPAKLWAFSAKESGNTRREWFKFFIVATLALGVQELVSVLALRFVADPYFSDYSLFIREKGSHLAGMACSFIANFLGHRFFTFRTTGLYDFLRPAGR